MQHAEDLFKRGINVLEDSSNWDWDESQQMAVSSSPSRFLVLILFFRDAIPTTNTKTFETPSFRSYVKKGFMYLVDPFPFYFFFAVLRFEEI